MYVIFAPLKRDKNHIVSQMAHAKNLGSRAFDGSPREFI